MIRVRIADTLAATSKCFGIGPDVLTARHTRNMREVRARWAGMLVARELTAASYPMIAKVYGRDNHTTVIHGVKRLRAAMARNSHNSSDIVGSIRKVAVDLALSRHMAARPLLLTYQPNTGETHAAHN